MTAALIPQTDPLWWDDAGPPEPPAPQGALPSEAAVVIVGAGLTGLSAARSAARAGADVLVLEAGAPGIGASSRNGGMIGGGHRLSLDAMTAQFGPDTARDLLREAHIDSVDFCLRLMQDEGIDCDFRQTGRFRAFWRDDEYDTQARALEAMRRVVPLAARMVSRADQRQEVATDLYRGGMVYDHHGGLNPAKWLKGILAAARRAGARVEGGTPVLSVQHDGRGATLRTPRGTVRAGQVLVATNGYTPADLPQFRRRIVPVPSFIVATETLGANRVRDLFPGGKMIVETRSRHCYYRPSPDGTRLVFGGRAAMVWAPEAFTQRQMRRLMTQVFPDLAEVGLTHSWRGRTGFALNTMPAIGQLDGIWYAMGYSGNGNAMAPWLGHKAALLMLGQPEGATAFSQTGLPARWWHRGAPWFLPAADLALRLQDLREGRSRN